MADLQAVGGLEIWESHMGEPSEPAITDRSMLLTYGNTCTNTITQERRSLNVKRSTQTASRRYTEQQANLYIDVTE